MQTKEMSVFATGKSNDAFAQYFQGQSYLNMLSTEQVSIGNVTFEPGCRNNWHIHHADQGGGQILLVMVSSSKCQKSWCDQGGNRRNIDTYRILCRLAESMGSISHGKRDLDRK